MTKEALKLALEALEEAWYHVGTFQPTEKAIDLYDEARTAIKEALAQPEQEPVACVEYIPCCTDQTCPKCKAATQPQRKPLTDEEFRAILRSLSRQQGWDGDGWDLALKEAIEAAHGIKELA